MIYPTVGVLKLLRDTGTPAVVEVAPEDEDRVYRITRDGNRSEILSGPHSAQEMAERMRDVLSLYPHPVTVNGEQVERLPFEGTARVSLSRCQGYVPGADQEEETIYTPFLKEAHQRYDVLAGGVLAGGVLAATGAGHGGGIQYDHSPGRQDNPHWRFADTIQVAPLTVIEPRELARMTDASMERLTGELRGLGLSRRMGVKTHSVTHDLIQRVMNRDQEQVKGALELPQMPERHEGDVFWYQAGKSELTRFGAPAIIVYGAPVIIPDNLGSNCEIASVAEAMYRHGTGEVPVMLGWASTKNEEQLPRVARFNFQAGTREGQGNVQWTGKIRLTYFLQGEKQGEEQGREIPADFTASGRPHQPRITLSREGEVPAHLSERLGYAYSNDVVNTDTQEWAETSERAEREIVLQVKMETEDAGEAHLEELRMVADQMAFRTLNPGTEMSATSQHRTVTVTSRPE